MRLIIPIDYTTLPDNEIFTITGDINNHIEGAVVYATKDKKAIAVEMNDNTSPNDIIVLGVGIGMMILAYDISK